MKNDGKLSERVIDYVKSSDRNEIDKYLIMCLYNSYLQEEDDIKNSSNEVSLSQILYSYQKILDKVNINVNNSKRFEDIDNSYLRRNVMTNDKLDNFCYMKDKMIDNYVEMLEDCISNYDNSIIIRNKTLENLTNLEALLKLPITYPPFLERSIDKVLDKNKIVGEDKTQIKTK